MAAEFDRQGPDLRCFLPVEEPQGQPGEPEAGRQQGEPAVPARTTVFTRLPVRSYNASRIQDRDGGAARSAATGAFPP